MAATAFAAGNPLFAYPEVVAVAAALKPYFENISDVFRKTSGVLHLDTVIKLAAAGAGAATIVTHAHSLADALPPASLSAIAIAFSGNVKAEVYRLLTLSGGAGLVIGSSISGFEAIQQNNTVGAIMSGAFLALNALFTRSEWKVVQKMGGVKALVKETASSIMKLLRSKNLNDDVHSES